MQQIYNLHFSVIPQSASNLIEFPVITLQALKNILYEKNLEFSIIENSRDPGLYLVFVSLRNGLSLPPHEEIKFTNQDKKRIQFAYRSSSIFADPMQEDVLLIVLHKSEKQIHSFFETYSIHCLEQNITIQVKRKHLQHFLTRAWKPKHYKFTSYFTLSNFENEFVKYEEYPNIELSKSDQRSRSFGMDSLNVLGGLEFSNWSKFEEYITSSLVKFQTLLEVDLSGRKLTVFNPSIIMQLPQLKFLNLSNNRICDIVESSVDDMKSHRKISLNLSRNRLERLRYPKRFNWLNYVSSLDLSKNPLHDIPSFLLSWMNSPCELIIDTPILPDTVNIKDSKDESVFIKELNYYPKVLCSECLSTQELYISKVSTTFVNCSIRSDVKFDFGYKEKSIIDAINLKTMNARNIVYSLNLTGNFITSEGAKYLSMALKSPICHKLQTLDLSNNYIEDKGVRVLCEILETNTSLTTLILRNNGITTGGVVKYLCNALRKNETLQTIDLRRNQITYDGVNYLGGVLKSKLNQSLNVLLLQVNAFESHNIDHMGDVWQVNQTLLLPEVGSIEHSISLIYTPSKNDAAKVLPDATNITEKLTHYNTNSHHDLNFENMDLMDDGTKYLSSVLSSMSSTLRISNVNTQLHDNLYKCAIQRFIVISIPICKKCWSSRPRTKTERFCWKCVGFLKDGNHSCISAPSNSLFSSQNSALERSHPLSHSQTDSHLLSSNDQKMQHKGLEVSQEIETSSDIASGGFLYRCDLCNVTCSSLEGLRQHKQGRKHLRSLESLDNSLTCNMCGVRATNAHGLSLHKAGAKHKKIMNIIRKCILFNDQTYRLVDWNVDENAYVCELPSGRVKFNVKDGDKLYPIGRLVEDLPKQEYFLLREETMATIFGEK